MADYPVNMWVIGEEEFENFTYTGGKVIYIVEEASPKFASHPAIITAGALLPPYEAIQMELDQNYMDAEAIYYYYLASQEADPFVSIILAAAFNQTPIGIMFGKDEMNMQFPKMFIDYLYRNFGLVLGLVGKVNPYILEAMVPFDMAKLYNAGYMDYASFISKHPPLPIHPSAISKMAYEENPLVPNRNFEEYSKYFEMVKNMVHNNGGKFLVEPLIGL